jgi:hypothetical protein
MDDIILHEPIQIEIDGEHYDLTFTRLRGIPPHEDVWIAEVYDESADAFWESEDPPQGVTLGACLDAVIRAARSGAT